MDGQDQQDKTDRDFEFLPILYIHVDDYMGVGRRVGDVTSWTG